MTWRTFIGLPQKHQGSRTEDTLDPGYEITPGYAFCFSHSPPPSIRPYSHKLEKDTIGNWHALPIRLKKEKEKEKKKDISYPASMPKQRHSSPEPNKVWKGKYGFQGADQATVGAGTRSYVETDGSH